MGLALLLSGCGQADLERFVEDYRVRHEAGEVAALVAMHDWTGVPDNHRRQLIRTLEEETRHGIRAIHTRPVRPADVEAHFAHTGLVPSIPPRWVVTMVLDTEDSLTFSQLVGVSQEGLRWVGAAVPDQP